MEVTEVIVHDYAVWVGLGLLFLYVVIQGYVSWRIIRGESLEYNTDMVWKQAVVGHLELHNESMGKIERDLEAIQDIMEERMK